MVFTHHALGHLFLHPSPCPVDFFPRRHPLDLAAFRDRRNPFVAVDNTHKLTEHQGQIALLKRVRTHGLRELEHLLINFIVFAIALFKAYGVFGHLIKQSPNGMVFLLKEYWLFQCQLEHGNLAAIDHLAHLWGHHHGLAKTGKGILHHLKNAGVIAMQATTVFALPKLFNGRSQIPRNLAITSQLTAVTHQMIDMFIDLGKELGFIHTGRLSCCLTRSCIAKLMADLMANLMAS